MENSFSLKDDLFNIETLTELARALKVVYDSFDNQGFISECLAGFSSRALKERMSYVSLCLEKYLPSDYMVATNVMVEACKVTEAKESFIFGAFCEYVEVHGCTDEYLEHSLMMLGEYTKIFSAEFAIRRFINQYPNETFEQMMVWAKSSDSNQRRLASEGLRPKLPWGSKITMDPRRAMQPLDHLYHDHERYVTRSVANHLNDIAKFSPELVIATLKRWKVENKQDEKEMEYIISHSTRTLVKQCHQGALALLGYDCNVTLEIEDFTVETPRIVIGDALLFSFSVRSLEATKLMVDYLIDYPMANGKRSKKVFKIKKLLVGANEKVSISKRHPFKRMTTKKLYTGDYQVILQINGKQYDARNFYLKVDE